MSSRHVAPSGDATIAPDPRSRAATLRPRATLSDVARVAGVSVSVASRSLSGDPALRARPETRRRIRHAAEALGYAPSHAARSLRLARAFTVGLVVRDLMNPLREPLLRGIEDAADQLGYAVHIVDRGSARPGADIVRSLVEEGRADGFLVQWADEPDAGDLSLLVETGAPVILLDARGPGAGSVVIDDVAGARLATSYLLELGHRDIAFIGGSSQGQSNAALEQGFLGTIRAAGLRRRSAWLRQSGCDPLSGRAAMHTLCTGPGRRPTAFVVTDVLAAMGALQAARDVGLEVPQQLSVVALRDAWVAEHTCPALTTVRMPIYELGRAAMQQLHECLQGGVAKHTIITTPTPQLIVRESTAPPPRRLLRGRRHDVAAGPGAGA